MKLLLTVWFLALASVFPVACATTTPEIDLPRVGRIKCWNGTGSGVALGGGWVLTCKHVDNVKGNPKRFDHPTQDLSLLYDERIEDGPIVVFGLKPKFGDQLRALGWHGGYMLLLTRGFAGATDGSMSCPVVPGCSGGAVLNVRGELVGIISQVASTNHGQPHNERYVVPHMAHYEPLDLLWMAEIMKQ